MTDPGRKRRFRIEVSDGRTLYTEAKTATRARNKVAQRGLLADWLVTGAYIVSCTAIADGSGREGVWELDPR